MRRHGCSLGFVTDLLCSIPYDFIFKIAVPSGEHSEVCRRCAYRATASGGMSSGVKARDVGCEGAGCLVV